LLSLLGALVYHLRLTLGKTLADMAATKRPPRLDRLTANLWRAALRRRLAREGSDGRDLLLL